MRLRASRRVSTSRCMGRGGAGAEGREHWYEGRGWRRVFCHQGPPRGLQCWCYKAWRHSGWELARLSAIACVSLPHLVWFLTLLLGDVFGRHTPVATRCQTSSWEQARPS
jgi:hypothetical protein